MEEVKEEVKVGFERKLFSLELFSFGPQVFLIFHFSAKHCQAAVCAIDRARSAEAMGRCQSNETEKKRTFIFFYFFYFFIFFLFFFFFLHPFYVCSRFRFMRAILTLQVPLLMASFSATFRIPT
jgi:hypothetical protein